MISTIGPLDALTVIGVMYVVARLRENGEPHNGSFRVAASDSPGQSYLSLVLLLTFLVYSPVSSTLFRAYACDKLDDGTSYLRADYCIDCNSPTHRIFQAYAALMILLCTVGIPVLYGILHVGNKKVLMDEMAREEDAIAKSMPNLWQLYRPSRFYYELIECARRLLLAGAVVFIFPNTVSQVAVALMLASFFMVLSEMLRPYDSLYDAWLNRIGTAIVFSSVYLALLLKVDVSSERRDSQRVFEATLVATHVFVLVGVVLGGIGLTCRWLRRVG